MTLEFSRPKIFCSRCLYSSSPCRYDGAEVVFPFGKKLALYADITTLCPELEIGLGVPRSPIRIIAVGDAKRLAQPQTGLDLTSDLTVFSRVAAEILGGIDGFIFKSRSPSCGVKDVKAYDDILAEEPSGKTVGIFAAELLTRFKRTPALDDETIAKRAARDRFLTAVFTLAQFRAAAEQGGIGRLTAFHARHKYLFMSFDQNRMRKLGNIAANRQKLPERDVFAPYFEELKRLLAGRVNRANAANALEHVFGYFKKTLDAQEKAHFLETLEKYRYGRRPMSAALALLRSWAERADDEYLLNQSVFAPYPPELMYEETAK